MKAFDVGVEPSVVDAVPVRDDDVAVLRDVVLVLGAVALAVASDVDVDSALDRVVDVADRELLDDPVEDEDAAEKPLEGLALAEVRTTCCDE